MTPRNDRLVVAILCALAALICLGPSISGELFYDDSYLIGQDQRLLNGIDWIRLWTNPYWGEQLWRPLTLTGFGIQLRLSEALGLAHPGILMHLTSLLLYVLCVVSFAAVLLALTRSVVAALVAGLFFAVHPVHVEAVASVVGQAELLVGLAACATILVLARFRSGTREQWNIILLLTVVAAGMVSKEQGFVLPSLIVTYLFLLPPAAVGNAATRRLALYPIALAISLWLIRSAVLYSGVGATPAESLDSLGLADRLMAALGMLPQVTALLVLPINLAQEYSPPGVPVQAGFTGAHFIGLGIVAGTATLFFWCRRRNPVVALGVAWTAIAWLPVSSILVTTGILIAERTLFLPSMGVAIVVGGLLSRVAASSRATTFALGFASAPILLLGWISISRSEVWHDAESFFSAMTRDQPNGYRAWFTRGKYELSQGNPRGATSLYRQAVQLWPESANASEDLGALLRQRRDCGAAVPILARSLKSSPMRTRLRALLVECLLETEDSVGAYRAAVEGLKMGDSSFVILLDRFVARRSTLESP